MIRPAPSPAPMYFRGVASPTLPSLYWLLAFVLVTVASEHPGRALAPVGAAHLRQGAGRRARRARHQAVLSRPERKLEVRGRPEKRQGSCPYGQKSVGKIDVSRPNRRDVSTTRADPGSAFRLGDEDRDLPCGPALVFLVRRERRDGKLP